MIDYEFDQPVERLVFQRSSGDYRRSTWAFSNENFVVRRIAELDVIQRVDNKPFKRFSAQITPYTEVLHGEYNPFLAFSDGDFALFTGQFSVGDAPMMNGGDDPLNSDDPYSAINWPKETSLKFLPGPYKHIIVGGNVTSKSAQSKNTLREFVYFGDAGITETETMNIVMDPATPDWMRHAILDSMKALSPFYSEKITPRQTRPTLFSTYAEIDEGGWSFKGDVLPGQVAMSLLLEDGSYDREKMRERLVLLFAHEVAHLWQDGSFYGGTDSWVHEGGAEATSILALEAVGQLSTDKAISTFNEMIGRCAKILDGGSYKTALRRQGGFTAGYDCGGVIQFALNTALKQSEANGDLFSFWNAYNMQGDAGSMRPPSEFIENIKKAGLTDFADSVTALLTEDGGAELIANLFNVAGVRFDISDDQGITLIEM